MSLSIQWLTIGAMLMSGIGMGILFDGYRVVSTELKFPRWTLSLLDLTYWIGSAILVFRMLYASNHGEVRAYVFIGLAIGVLLYYWLFSQLTTTLVRWLITAVKWLVAFIIRLIQIFIVTPLLWLWTACLFILNVGTKFTIGFGKIMLQLLLPILKLVLWLLSPLTKPIGKWLSPYWTRWRVKDRLGKLWESSLKLLARLRRK